MAYMSITVFFNFTLYRGHQMVVYSKNNCQGPGKVITKTNSFQQFERLAGCLKIFKYNGNYAKLSLGTYTIDDLFHLGIGRYLISSVEVDPGYQVTLYSVDGCESCETFTVNSDSSSQIVKYFNDRTNSVKVTDHTDYVIVYDRFEFTGRAMMLTEGQYELSELSIFKISILSIKVIGDIKITLFTRSEFMGKSKSFTQSINRLDVHGMDDVTSSVIIEKLD
jgi:hypothetical protein